MKKLKYTPNPELGFTGWKLNWKIKYWRLMRRLRLAK